MEEKLRRIMHPEKSSKKMTREQSAAATIRTRAWRLKHPERYAAQNVLNNALRDGKIKRPESCEICGGESHLHAHHENYRQPLLVVWLCARCHGQIQ